jgi:hypothetical protein
LIEQSLAEPEPVEPEPVEPEPVETPPVLFSQPVFLDLEPRMLSFLELQRGQCRYLLPDAYCGAFSQAGSPYCTEHHKLCYLERKPRRW